MAATAVIVRQQIDGRSRAASVGRVVAVDARPEAVREGGRLASLTTEFVDHVIQLAGSPGRSAVAQSKRLLLDHLGVVIGGSDTPEARVARQALLPDEASDVGAALPVQLTSGAVPIQLSAFLNALAGHALEMDDVHNASSSHPGVVVWPSVLAAAALSGADESTCLRGALVGYEVMGRIGRAINPPAHYARHYHPTGTVGHFAAAAAASTVLGLDSAGVVMALGIALSTASGSMEFLTDGAWTKRIHPANAVRDGIEAALLAREGFLGPSDAIGGSRGFLAGFSDDPHPEKLMGELGGSTLEIERTSIKPYACCRYNQPAIDAILQLRNEHGISADDCQEIILGLPSTAINIVAEPSVSKRHPSSVVDAQFSIYHGAAIALIDGKAGVEEHQTHALDRDVVGRTREMIRCVADPDIDSCYPEQWRGWARVRLRSGETVEASVDWPRGDPENPLTEEEVWLKFAELASGRYSPTALKAISGAVSAFGSGESVEPLLHHLRGSDARVVTQGMG